MVPVGVLHFSDISELVAMIGMVCLGDGLFFLEF